MRIYYSPTGGDPMIKDTRPGLKKIHRKFHRSLRSPEETIEFPAATDHDPAPYSRFLCGLRVIKHQGGTRLTLGDDGWLVLEGSPQELDKCAEQFLVHGKNDHSDLYTNPVALIIESDSSTRKRFRR